jgi:hypothetical protein
MAKTTNATNPTIFDLDIFLPRFEFDLFDRSLLFG